MFSDRTGFLIGNNGVDLLRRCRVMVLGVGGVGGVAAEMLARAGVGELLLMDGDKVDESNLNRQIIALNSTLGISKVEAFKRRLTDINPDLKLTLENHFLQAEEVDDFLDSAGRIDFAVDAIDSLPAKAAFIAGCVKRNIPLVSSMGSGGRMDPGKVQIADISRTFNCRLARSLRGRLKKDYGITRKVKCVFSSETVPESAVHHLDPELKKTSCGGKEPSPAAKKVVTGTISYLPAVFGCFLASEAIRSLLAASGEENSPESCRS